ncbi:hypothetical protein D3C84_339850 [compost metagenome]
MGLDRKSIEQMIGVTLKEHAESKNLYITNKLPKGNQAFETYALLISPNVGLCEIRAVGEDIKSGAQGTQLISAFENMGSLLDGVYGTPKRYDFLASGSLWKESQYWMMGLSKGERYLSSDWESSQSKPLKNSLKTVNLSAHANSSSAGYLRLDYEFENNSKCKEEIDQAQQGGL